MLHFYKFRETLFAPRPARDVYLKRPAGKGWPEECPPIRAANGFGFDLLANFDLAFRRKRDGSWAIDAGGLTLASDFDYVPGEAGAVGGGSMGGTGAATGATGHDSAGDRAGDASPPDPSADDSEGEPADQSTDAPPPDAGRPLSQTYAWFWERGQTLPHPISDNVWHQINNQVKVSTFLFLKTDPNELLYFTDVPNLPADRGWRAMTALVDTDWYPASYPWHAVLELDRRARRVEIEKGEPLCRVMPVRRDTYFAAEMTPVDFDAFFDRGQRWLATHGKFEHEAADSAGHVDITRTYGRQQLRSKFVVLG